METTCLNMRITTPPTGRARYYINGRRVSMDAYEHIADDMRTEKSAFRCQMDGDKHIATYTAAVPKGLAYIVILNRF